MRTENHGPEVVDAGALERAVERCREAGIVLPTFAQLDDLVTEIEQRHGHAPVVFSVSFGCGAYSNMPSSYPIHRMFSFGVPSCPSEISCSARRIPMALSSAQRRRALISRRAST